MVYPVDYADELGKKFRIHHVKFIERNETKDWLDGKMPALEGAAAGRPWVKYVLRELSQWIGGEEKVYW